MNRLQRELRRLYGHPADAVPDLDGRGDADAQGCVRALVLGLARPADWTALLAVWDGVQAELALPAPAIAVNGSDGFQLWFSLMEPVSVPQAAGFLDALRRRYLGDTAPVRVTLRPAPDALSAPSRLHAKPVPALQDGGGRWSAFVASDLAPLFTEEPWLDVPPNLDGQAQLLVPLRSIATVDFEFALQRLRPALPPAPPGPAEHPLPLAAASVDPRRFLLDVMNNDSLDMALRIDAAKALLPGFEAAPGPRQEQGKHDADAA